MQAPSLLTASLEHTEVINDGRVRRCEALPLSVVEVEGDGLIEPVCHLLILIVQKHVLFLLPPAMRS